MQHRARFYEKRVEKIRCLLCPHRCLLGEGEVGLCGVREVSVGELYTKVYNYVAALNWDPIEKKPLYHFHPEKTILSVGTVGCNLGCSFCQNWTLARGRPDQKSDIIKPEDLLAMLDREGGRAKTIGLAYTYNEPTVWYEYVFDTARLLHERGYKNVLVTNGYINREPLLEILPYIDAMNIDVKGFTNSFYKDYCQGSMKPVIETVETAVKHCHVEITCLLIPGLNDDLKEQEELASWLGNLSRDLVLHYSRYFPQYKLDIPPTSPETMIGIREMARKYLRYVYLGNIDFPGTSDTICPHCGNLLVKRSGYRVRVVGLDGVNCNNCRNQISVILSDNNE
ncbi:MAG: AmmeMemoRadiSam system radical SAM enzyme [Bacillota bacterium]|nr:AmmeMemoRadiSam system radical SAM enzyme [Bacillota bacterium]